MMSGNNDESRLHSRRKDSPEWLQLISWQNLFGLVLMMRLCRFKRLPAEYFRHRLHVEASQCFPPLTKHFNRLWCCFGVKRSRVLQTFHSCLFPARSIIFNKYLLPFMEHAMAKLNNRKSSCWAVEMCIRIQNCNLNLFKFVYLFVPLLLSAM